MFGDCDVALESIHVKFRKDIAPNKKVFPTGPISALFSVSFRLKKNWRNTADIILHPKALSFRFNALGAKEPTTYIIS